MLRGTECIKAFSGSCVDEVVLDYEDRHRRRIMMRGISGTRFLLDLCDVPDMREGDAIKLSSGVAVRVRAAQEALIEIECESARHLARIAWHLGNRHVPADIGAGTIRTRADHVLAEMVCGLGGRIRAVTGPFDPEGGAYAHASEGHAASNHD